MTGPISAADQRGLDWFLRWHELDCGLEVAPDGNLELKPPPSCRDPAVAGEILAMRQRIHSDPLLAHAVGRVLLDYFRWEEAGGGTPEGPQQ